MQYKLEGLVLMIEGIGRRRSDGQPVLQALGFISFDDERKTYQLRSFNEGRFLEADVKLSEDGGTLTWGFVFGAVKMKSVLRINEKGEWTETHEITIGSEPPKKLMEVEVHRST